MCSANVRRRLRASALSLLASAALALGACGGHFVARGAELYDNGRYVDAAEVFERTEGRLAQSPSDERARFGLYRGATYLKLGDAVHAARWLGYARSVVTSDPGALDSDEHQLLEASLKTLASAKRALPEPETGSEVATAPAAE
jgi:hypothetical protein